MAARRLKIQAHRAKRLKRVRKELLHLRKRIITSFNDINSTRYAGRRVEQIKQQVKKDRQNLKHIDAVIIWVHEQLGEPKPELNTPRVTIKVYKPAVTPPPPQRAHDYEAKI